MSGQNRVVELIGHPRESAWRKVPAQKAEGYL
jgi:hypothetical protein